MPRRVSVSCVNIGEAFPFPGGYPSYLVSFSWDMKTGQCLRLYEGHAGGVKYLQIDDDGQVWELLYMKACFSIVVIQSVFCS